ncbi:phage neck terminator protein [Entomobacter blattae]|uniref:Phage neck terminator protein gp12-like domain-containing protein n=1 Tax=Entomobacter blattae TaxID=2762277 RepID=A0A7H1NU50_9PROT|nr:hypothetical protein [Entomobacter blattae]QNT79310.1 hypothetical protein JGUZn3_21070 [Entomobacter blattae]
MEQNHCQTPGGCGCVRTSPEAEGAGTDTGPVDARISGVIVALRAYLIDLFPGLQVEYGQTNYNVTPGQPFALITPITQVRLSTNRSSYSATGKLSVQPIKLRYQIDFFRDGSQDRATILAQLFRDVDAATWFARYTAHTSPLYADEVHQTALINESDLYEERWTVDVLLQYNNVILQSQKSTDRDPSVIEVGV